MKKIIFVNALELCIVIAALVANFSVLPVGAISALMLLVLALIWLGVKMYRFDKSTSWKSAFNYVALAGVFSFIVLGITELCVENTTLGSYAYAALGTFLFGTLSFLLSSFPLEQDTPVHLILSVIGCVLFMCTGWVVGLFGDVALWVEKLMSAFGCIVFGYFVISLLCFIWSCVYQRRR